MWVGDFDRRMLRMTEGGEEAEEAEGVEEAKEIKGG
jgi:hypothetical protein